MTAESNKECLLLVEWWMGSELLFSYWICKLGDVRNEPPSFNYLQNNL